MNVDKMKAGRETDALIAERVMGFSEIWYGTMPSYWDGDAQRLLPRYSTDIAAAWEVVEKLEADGFYFTFDNGAYSSRSSKPGEWYVADFQKRLKGQGVKSHAPTAQLAICRAALKAVEKE